MSAIIIDTCAALWLSSDGAISDEATAALDGASDTGTPIYVSPITAWEVGMLASKDRVKLLMTPERWFEGLLARSGLRLADMPPRVLIASSFLPGRPPNDPADRIIAATARDLGATLITRDRQLLAYAEQGYLRAVAC